jgi:hypothetical protein
MKKRTALCSRSRRCPTMLTSWTYETSIPPHSQKISNAGRGTEYLSRERCRSFAFATTEPLLNISGCANTRRGERWTNKPIGIDLRASWGVENEDMCHHGRHEETDVTEQLRDILPLLSRPLYSRSPHQTRRLTM